MRSSSNAALLMYCQPSVRPTTARRSCPEISSGIKPVRRAVEPRVPTRSRDRTRKSRSRSPRNPPARSARVRSVALDFRRPRRRSHARVVGLGRHVRRVLVPGPDRGRNLGLSAARRRVEDRRGHAVAQERTPGRGLGRALVRGRRRPHHLAVGLIAEVEAVGVVAPAVRQREGPDRDRQRFERGGPAVAPGLAGQHARDVGFEREGLHRVAAARTQRRRCESRAADPAARDDEENAATEAQRAQRNKPI